MSSKGFRARKAEYQREKRMSEREKQLPEGRRCVCGRLCITSRMWVVVRAQDIPRALVQRFAQAMRNGYCVVCRSCWWKALADSQNGGDAQ